MSEEAMTHVTSAHVQPAAPLTNLHQQGGAILLCRNSLVAIGLKHLLQGTAFAITDTASD